MKAVQGVIRIPPRRSPQLLTADSYFAARVGVHALRNRRRFIRMRLLHPWWPKAKIYKELFQQGFGEGKGLLQGLEGRNEAQKVRQLMLMFERYVIRGRP